MVLALRRRAQTYLTVCLPPTYRLCLSLSLPTPLICKTQFSPNLIFLLFLFPVYFPTTNRPLTPFNVYVLLTYVSLAYSQPLRSLPRGE